MSFFRRKIEPARPLRPVRPTVDQSAATSRPYEATDHRPAAERPASSSPAPATEHDGELHVLVVCTANVCRSPLGAALLGATLARRGITSTVTSAGTSAARLPVDPRSAEYALRVGADIRDHLPRQVDPELLVTEGRDLVLTMGREHLRETAVMAPRHLSRMFTLKEFARRSAAAPAEPGESFADWVTRLAAGRRPTDLLGEQTADEIRDPYDRSDAMFREVAAEIDSLIGDVVDRVVRFDELNPTKRGG